MKLLSTLNDGATSWCRGRGWFWRAALLVFLGYVGARHCADPRYSSIFGGINLGIHEAGHLLFVWTGSDFLHAAGGTILQMAAPVIAAFLFLRQPDYFGACVCGPWLATNMYESARYIADARSLSLNLVSVGGGDAQHDWQYLLGCVGMLPYDTTLAAFVRVGAFVCMWGGILAGAYLILRMALPETQRSKPRGPILLTLRRKNAAHPVAGNTPPFSEGASLETEDDVIAGPRR